MKPIRTLCIVFLVVLSQTLVSAQQQKTLSDAKISFVYTSNDTDGTISGFSSSSNLDMEQPENSVFKGEVKTASIKTGNFLRDWSLKGSKYFDADTYPTISFESSSVSTTATGFEVKGVLTIKKTSKSIRITFIKNGKQLTGTTTLYASDYGIHVKKEREANKVTVKMVFTLK